MSENIIVKDLQKLDPGSELVHLFELEYVQGSFVYFHSDRICQTLFLIVFHIVIYDFILVSQKN